MLRAPVGKPVAVAELQQDRQVAGEVSLADVRALVADEFELVGQEIKHQINSHVPLVETISSHIVGGGGKRLRPLLVLLTARCLGLGGRLPAKLAVVIEFLHTATLLHDDVVDISPTRRGRETAFFRWGGAASVLVGDVLFSRAFDLMIELESFEILRQLSRATTKISEGEVAQLAAIGNMSQDQSAYMEVISAKTASLFEISTSTASILACGTPEVVSSARQFGLNFGISYQLIDDLLDYQGHVSRMGKEPGNDLLEGKLTAPVIHALANGSKCDAETIRSAFSKRNPGLFTRVQEAVQRSGGLEYTHDQAKRYSQKAIDYAMALPDNTFRDALVALVEFNLTRHG